MKKSLNFKYIYFTVKRLILILKCTSILIIIVSHLLHFLALLMDLTVLFQLTFTFIYSTFSNYFSVLAK